MEFVRYFLCEGDRPVAEIFNIYDAARRHELKFIRGEASQQ